MMSVPGLKLGWERCSEQSPPFDGTPLQAAGGSNSSSLPLSKSPRVIMIEKGLTR